METSSRVSLTPSSSEDLSSSSAPWPLSSEDEDDGDVAEGETVGIESRLAEELSPALLEAEMHAREEAAADEGHLVDDEELHIGPGPLEAFRCFAL